VDRVNVLDIDNELSMDQPAPLISQRAAFQNDADDDFVSQIKGGYTRASKKNMELDDKSQDRTADYKDVQ
jgi:hypothetical protein